MWGKHRPGEGLPRPPPARPADRAPVRWARPHTHAARTVSPHPAGCPLPLSRPFRALSALALPPTWREDRGPPPFLPAPTQLSTSGTVASPRLTRTASAHLLLTTGNTACGLRDTDAGPACSLGSRGVKDDWPLSPGHSLGRPPSPRSPTLPFCSAQLLTGRNPRSSNMGP